mmetsp:Transcript_72580/g.155449  ORF Transcript_72580/g.155449 Transcript_72580/m.155449 type:complete len:237 (-) Transcript_72580:53-763(-)
MYRAQNDVGYEIQNDVLGNLAAVLWNLHKEVVSACPRLNGITRILRLKVTMKPTMEVFSGDHWHHPIFGPFADFQQCQCMRPDCPNIWEKFGFSPGCKNLHPNGEYYYPDGVWYSLPGSCPSMGCQGKTPQCTVDNPGGQCANVDGSRACTWRIEPAGEIRLDELVGIGNHDQFCAAGGREWVPSTDRGVKAVFWDGFYDASLCKQRVDAAARLFEVGYPSMPKSFPTPACVAVPW